MNQVYSRSMQRSLPFPSIDEEVFKNPDSLLRFLRAQRAYRVGLKICRAATVISCLTMIVDFFLSTRLMFATDVVLFFGCALSLYLTNRNFRDFYFSWKPLYICFWAASIPTIYMTGGLWSPLIGLALALYYLLPLVIQVTLASTSVLIFSVLNLLIWIVLAASGMGPQPGTFVQQDLLASGANQAFMFAGLAVCVFHFLKTEAFLSQEITRRSNKLVAAKIEMAQADQANAAKTAFITNVSHEIRTPLSAVIGYSELLLNPQVSPQEKEAFAETIRRNGEQLLHLVDDILDLSKVEAGKINLELVPFKFPELLLDVVNLLKPIATKKEIEIVVKPLQNIPTWLVSDPTRIKQILMNIVGNAIKFTQRGQVEVETSFSEPESLLVRIRDSGLGIEVEQQAQLFRPFTQADVSTTRRFGGTGLGLVLSRHLARLLGGDVVLLSSEPGRGSVFGISIHAKVPEQSMMGSSSTDAKDSSDETESKFPLKGLRILLAEDSVDNQFLTMHLLKSSGAEAEVANDGREAIDLAARKDFDLILMDIQMPQLDGYEATRLLRRKGYGKPILALTAHALQEERGRCLAAGCNEHISKPIDRKELIQKIRTLLSKNS